MIGILNVSVEHQELYQLGVESTLNGSNKFHPRHLGTVPSVVYIVITETLSISVSLQMGGMYRQSSN